MISIPFMQEAEHALEELHELRTLRKDLELKLECEISRRIQCCEKLREELGESNKKTEHAEGQLMEATIREQVMDRKKLEAPAEPNERFYNHCLCHVFPFFSFIFSF
jgi:hypothetical protein